MTLNRFVIEFSFDTLKRTAAAAELAAAGRSIRVIARTLDISMGAAVRAVYRAKELGFLIE